VKSTALKITLILFISACITDIFGQDLTPPDRPYITYVSVDTATNNSLIYWDKSPSNDVEWYLIYYEIFTANGYEGVKFDSVSADLSFYEHIGGSAGSESVLYSVTAIDSSGNESIRKPGLHSTINTGISYDSCNSLIQLTWNKYIGWGDSISGYRVFFKPPGGSFSQISGVGANDTTYKKLNIEENYDYEFFVEGVKYDGLVSRSNISRKYTYMPPPPVLNELLTVDVINDNQVDISFNFSNTSIVNDFALMRSGSKDADFIIIQKEYDLSSSPYTFTDNITTSIENYYYRVGAMNTCDQVINLSNYGVSILLNSDTINNNVILRWNEFEQWSQGVQEYRVYRKNASGQFEDIGTTGDTNYTDDLSTIYNSGLTGELYYYVEAVRTGGNVTARSNVHMIRVSSKILIPNAFTPNHDGKNDSFRPVLSFFPKNFLMVIYDRNGTIIYRSDNYERGWDGSVNGKSMAPEGIYLYHIQYSSQNGTRVNKTGNLTLFYP